MPVSLDFLGVHFYFFNCVELFQLKDYVEYMGSSAQVILVPSIRDAHHDFVFPQVIILKIDHCLDKS